MPESRMAAPFSQIVHEEMEKIGALEGEEGVEDDLEGVEDDDEEMVQPSLGRSGRTRAAG
jgi:hypothetical protein